MQTTHRVFSGCRCRLHLVHTGPSIYSETTGWALSKEEIKTRYENTVETQLINKWWRRAKMTWMTENDYTDVKKTVRLKGHRRGRKVVVEKEMWDSGDGELIERKKKRRKDEEIGGKPRGRDWRAKKVEEIHRRRVNLETDLRGRHTSMREERESKGGWWDERGGKKKERKESAVYQWQHTSLNNAQLCEEVSIQRPKADRISRRDYGIRRLAVIVMVCVCVCCCFLSLRTGALTLHPCCNHKHFVGSVEKLSSLQVVCRTEERQEKDIGAISVCVCVCEKMREGWRYGNRWRRKAGKKVSADN